MVELNNLTAFPLEEKFFKSIARKVIKKEKGRKSGVSIALVGKRRIRELNKKYLERDCPTDVLAFPDSISGDSVWPSKETLRASSRGILGEIVICPQVVKEDTEGGSAPFKRELARVLIHALLHLFGYDHKKSEEERREMREKENYYLSLFFKQPRK